MNIFDIHIRSILEKRIYSYSYSVPKMIFVTLWSRVVVVGSKVVGGSKVVARDSQVVGLDS